MFDLIMRGLGIVSIVIGIRVIEFVRTAPEGHEFSPDLMGFRFGRGEFLGGCFMAVIGTVMLLYGRRAFGWLTDLWKDRK